MDAPYHDVHTCSAINNISRVDKKSFINPITYYGGGDGTHPRWINEKVRQGGGPEFHRPHQVQHVAKHNQYLIFEEPLLS
jgi:hypothetical protein